MAYLKRFIIWILALVLLVGCASIKSDFDRGPASISKANSGWKDKTIAFASDFGLKPVLFHDPVVATLWGASNDFGVYPDSTSTEVKRMDIPSKKFLKKSIPVYYHWQPKRAPLMVILPGLFGSPKDALNLRMIRAFARRGYHVLALLSPWSTDFVERLPVFNPGNVISEAETAIRLITLSKEMLGKANIASTNIFAISYGAFLAPVIVNMDMQREGNLFDGSITLVAPPVSIHKATKKLDEFIDSASRRRECDFAHINPVATIGLIFKQSEKGLHKNISECSGEIMASMGFYPNLKNFVTYLYENRPIGFTPEHLQDEDVFEKWVDKVRFRHYLKDFAPELTEMARGKKTSLQYWIAQAEAKGSSRFRIITSKDDMLNELEDWNSPDLKLDSKNFIQLDWGGHAGFKSLPWFEQFLDIEFGTVQD